jgi:transposase
MQRHELTDREWVRLEPLLGKRRTGRPPKDHRIIVNGLLWLAKTGAPWRDLPERSRRAAQDGGRQGQD